MFDTEEPEMTITTFAEAEQALAANLPGYAPRPQQQRLAVAVEGLFANREGQLLAQAGCGVGKSLASLIPAILSGGRIVYATATKALQEQIAGKDVPFLQEFLGVDFTWALLKGRSNYVCAAKMAEITPAQITNVEAIREELADFENHSGDFEHLTNAVAPDKQYLLSMSAAECPGKKECPFASQCFAEKAKEAARKAQVVITNTAMLMTDLKISKVSGGNVQMLGEYNAVVIDEAHELPEIASGALTEQLRKAGLTRLINSASGFLSLHGARFGDESASAALGLTEKVFLHLEGFARNSKDPVEVKMGSFAAELETYISLIEALEGLRDAVAETQIRASNPVTELTTQRRLVRNLTNMAGRLTELLTSEEMVRWVELETNRKRQEIITLKWSPIEVGPFLQEMLWETTPAALVSATLAVGTDFDYIARTLGLESPQTLDVGTPFDYSSQARLFVPGKGYPDPSPRTRTEWLSRSQLTTRELVQTSGGGALLLYTSRKAMTEAHATLAPFLADAGLTVLMQGEATNKELAKTFTEDEHSVLFALKSFFTGVDFSGETCRLVVIDKLPFPVPSDIMFNARANLINKRAGKDVSFAKLSVPMMTLPLIQGFGRLIRSVSDRGVVAILDSRLVSKGYGKNILRALPPAPMTHDMQDVADFYAA